MGKYNCYNRYNNYKNYTPSKGYKSLPFFIQVEFVRLYIDPYSQTKDQMEQGARSGKQNIPEAYLQKSLEGRIKLMGVSRGSLEELLNDYLDFLRQRGLGLWSERMERRKKT